MTIYMERAVHSVNCTCLSWALVKFCVCPSFPFSIEGGLWDVIVLIPVHCLSIYFEQRITDGRMFTDSLNYGSWNL